jgi:hypothetical protein
MTIFSTILFGIALLIFAGAIALILNVPKEPLAYLGSAILLWFSYIFLSMVGNATEWKTVKSEIVDIDHTQTLNTSTGIIFILDGKPRELQLYETVNKFSNGKTVIYHQTMEPSINFSGFSFEYFKMFDQDGKLLAQWKK